MNNNIKFNKDNIIKNPILKPYKKTKLENIIISLNYNEVVKDKKLLLPVLNLITTYFGQRPKIIKAKNSIAAFKIRKGMDIGAILTLRNTQLISNYKKLLITLPKLNEIKYNKKENNSLGITNISLLTSDINHLSGANITFNIKGSSQSLLLRYLLIPTFNP